MVQIGLYHVSKEFRSYNCRNRWLRAELISLLKGKRKAPDRWTVLRDVTLEIEKGDTVGILGRNGSGKSTLLKLIAGILRPNGGRVVTRGSIVTVLDIGTGFHEDLTGRENVFVDGAILGLSEQHLKGILPEIEQFAELQGFMDTPLRYYSSGMMARLGFAVAMHADPDVFLIDEILAVGDEGFRRKCFGKLDDLVARGKTIAVISHDTDAIRRLCSRAVWLHDGVIRADGPVSDVCREYLGYYDAIASDELTAGESV